MKKKIAIFGSTGSIGKTLLKIIDNDIKNFKITLLTANQNHNKLLKQAKKYKVKNLIIKNFKSYLSLKKKVKNLDIKVYNDFNSLDKIFKKKADYIMSAITGIDGLEPTINSIKYTRKIAIANKEAIICGWNLIFKELKKNKTQFVPVDSEHFSIWYGIKNNKDEIESIFLTASGGPFLNLPINKFKKINLKDALKHPNWKMGKKITIDSATMMNKLFEIIEARNIFNIGFDKISIITHPDSYIHSIIKFRNGVVKIIAHETDMKIPIFNSIYRQIKKIKFKTEDIDFKKLNNLQLENVNKKKFPLINVLKDIPSDCSLFETLLVSANDQIVNLFLNKKLVFTDISKMLMKFINKKEFKKYKLIKPKKIQDILKLNEYVHLKINSKSI